MASQTTPLEAALASGLERCPTVRRVWTRSELLGERRHDPERTQRVEIVVAQHGVEVELRCRLGAAQCRGGCDHVDGVPADNLQYRKGYYPSCRCGEERSVLAMRAVAGLARRSRSLRPTARPYSYQSDEGLADAPPIFNRIFLTRYDLHGELGVTGVAQVANALFELRFGRGAHANLLRARSRPSGRKPQSDAAYNRSASM